ncbi:transcriptional regulator, AraC family, putative [Rubellimicrobium mesophilum DSM 19309]|uniref:Transcriptional regulator, AraC family, putative n=1 Tax=Rubellimicrobium mesophilum DSM 19309 TaxID=442562 RepID=A0A017HHW2_9RHOB|nr:hypothetical protein [Rubellimicrobium mesophilum]EYD73915.1 transcriptional regulator, AraC family, putative [Rubellimicrobium mesophilum DSM 19309]
MALGALRPYVSSHETCRHSGRGVKASGPSARFADPRRSEAALRLLARQGVTLGGFSGGVFPLMRAQAMGRHRPSVHWCYEGP